MSAATTTYPPLPFVPPLQPGQPVPLPSQLQQTLDRVFYPESDGKPIAESTLQFEWIETIKGGIEILFADDPNVFVAADLLWYPVEGEPTINAAPDTMVVFGRPKGHRGSYLQWREANIAPQVVFEVLSPSNTREDMEAKRRWYEQYDVLEYLEYDPARFVFRVWERSSARWPFREVENVDGWVSPRLGIRFQWTPGKPLKVFFPDGRPFVSIVALSKERDAAQQAAREAKQVAREAEQAAREAEQTARDEQAARAAAEAKAEALTARLRALGIDPDAPAAE